MSEWLPKARKEDLLHTVVADEVVIYDTTNNNAYCLNELSSKVWLACDGKTTRDQMVETLIKDGDTEANRELIDLAISQLDDVKLLESTSESTHNENNKSRMVSRREAVSKITHYASGALPVISVLKIPPAIAQVSGGRLPNGSNCSSSGQCASGCCGTMSGKCNNSSNCLPW